MENNGASEVATSHGNITEDSESTVEIKIKTLDSQTYTLRVNKCVPIPRLKEQIADVTGVVSEQQRLICRGKVLKDDELLSAYHVEDGHTLHLVVRQPQQSSTSPSMGQMGPEGASSHPGATQSHGSQGSRTIVFEAVNIGHGDNRGQHLGQIMSGILNAFVPTNTGSNTSRIDARELGARASGDVPRGQLDSRQGPSRLHSAVPLGPQQPTVIPDSLTTIYQYLHFMQDEFAMEEQGEVSGPSPMHINHELNQQSSSQGGLPSPASLVELLLPTRQLLTEHAARLLSQFVRHLEDHVNITDPLLRANLQNSVLRTGVLLQNLGSLLLELGRTTMTLRLGQTPSEAVINAGPAVFISGTGPNPVMVQPVPFYPGPSFGASRMGALYPGYGLQGEPLGPAFPTSIGIRFRAGRAAPVSTSNPSEQDASQNLQDQANSSGNMPSTNHSHQPFSGVTGSASITGETGVRVVPITTVVAVPAGDNDRSPSDLSSSLGLLYPFLARVQHVNNSNLNDSSGIEASNEPNQDDHDVNQQANILSSMQSQNMESNSGGNNTTHPIPPLVSAESSRNEPARFSESLRNFSAGLQEPAISTNSTNIHVQTTIGQQIGMQSLSQLENQMDQWVRALFGREQVGVGSQEQSGQVAAAVQNGSTGNTHSDHVSETLQEESRIGTDGVFFSNLVRQLMPFISEATARRHNSSPHIQRSTSQVERQNSDGASSSHHPRDPFEDRSPKRQKKD